MNRAVEQIVNAVLYEGYILYPYRASSRKNQRQRFIFGQVYPQVFSERENGSESCAMQAECLLQTAGEFPEVKLSLGFLQPVTREIGAFDEVLLRLPDEGDMRWRPVQQLEAGGKTFRTWTEAVERRVSVSLGRSESPGEVLFAFPADETREAIRHENGAVTGVILRRRETLKGRIETKITRLAEGLFRVRARVVNQSRAGANEIETSEKAPLQTFASTHFTLEVETGAFVSLLETPLEFRDFAANCQNIGCWPVLVGDKSAGSRTTILASPIILYDYPQIAPESPGGFLDGTEIFMQNKDPRDTHFITSRISGIRGDNHATCSVHAQNMASGIKPPPPGEWTVNLGEGAESMLDHTKR